MPEWDEAAKSLADQAEESEEAQKYFLAAVDMDAHQDLKDKFDVTAVPYMMIYKNGELMYDDISHSFRRNAEGILTYFKNPEKPEDKE